MKIIYILLLSLFIGNYNLFAQDQTSIVDNAISAVGIISDSRENAFGSGFFINENTFITNFHVVESLSKTVTIKMKSGKKYSGNVLARTEEKDLAIVRIDDKVKTYLKLANPEDVHVSLPVYTLGTPSTSSMTFEFSVTQGIVSNTKVDNFLLKGSDSDDGIQVYAKVIFHTATINRGNSGGPLIFQNNGAVFGVNSFFFDKVNNMYFAIHVQELQDFLDKNKVKYETIKYNAGDNSQNNQQNSSTTNSGSKLKPITIILIIAGVLIVIAVVIILILNISKKNKRQLLNISGSNTQIKTIPEAYLKYSEQKYKITEKDLVLGREEGNDLMIPDLMISRRHCLVTYEGSNFIIKDLSSKNGTFVNGKKITNTILRSGDIIKVGTAEITFTLF